MDEIYQEEWIIALLFGDLDTVSRNHNKEEQVEGMDRFQAVSRRTAKIAITELCHSARYQLLITT